MKLNACIFALMTTALAALPAHALTLKLAGQYGNDSDDTRDMLVLKKEFEDKTDSDVKVRIFPANQLGDYTQVYEELRRGSIEMALITIPSQFDRNLELPYIPYLAKDWNEARRIYSNDSFLFKEMAQLNEKLGVKLLAFQPAGFGGLGMNKVPASGLQDPASDKSDVLIRVPPLAVFAEPIKDVGFKSVSIPWSDTYSAIQTGVADGWTGGSSILNYETMRDAIKYYWPINNWFDVRAWLVSEKAWNKLSEEQRVELQSITVRLATERMNANEEVEKEYTRKLAEHGVKILEVTPEQLDAYSKHAKEVTWPKLEKIYGAETMKKLAE
ncbi:TRAP transporter substrate-binding protein DctP [Pseudomonas sp. TTU2014-080ASC]|uniref:TRAP transporter substrate-binding protein DctP n=1 Tax=Pseudomonas sp. TTU2014-080ASC TaxID=1729724 RepID=UPI000718504D|nr:TRAP transporter substrate-binding protein DctP [Pseudomonas sp. TTU2014-080ASC]KRW61499.1 hypothetical protein AO726_09265 [Pseudomonas sp. TTU2014-080ASC]